MNQQIPAFRYVCRICGNRYPVFLENGKCYCGGTLFDAKGELTDTKGLWDTRVFTDFPCVLAHEYKRLFDFCEVNNLYGTFLQLKDVIEATIKFCVLAASAWGKAQNIQGREYAYEKELANEKLSLGNWVTIASYIRRFYKQQKNTNALPSPLWVLIDKLQAWVGNKKLVEWRNERLAHGALAFDTDPEFKLELVQKIKEITEFYHTNFSYFRDIHLFSESFDLQGSENAREILSETGECYLGIGSLRFLASPYIIHADHGIYFFDELLNRTNSRLLSYPMGRTKLWYSDYTSRLSSFLHQYGSLFSSTLDSDILTKAENDFISHLGCEGIGVKPEYILTWLKSSIESLDRGILLLEMERGCGKTFLSERISTRFRNPWLISDDIDVRTYHLSRTQIGGVREFCKGISYEWNHAFDREADTARSIELIYDENSLQNADNMIEYLRRWQEYTQSSDARGRKQKILLVLDGLDEITESGSTIWSFIPSPSDLPESVYILLTGRNTVRDKVTKNYIDHISHLVTSSALRVDARSKESTDFLKEYISSRHLMSISEQNVTQMLTLSQGKILVLSMLCNLAASDGINSVVAPTVDSIVDEYIRIIENHYSSTQKNELALLLFILSAIARFEPLSLREISDMMMMGRIKLSLLGMLTDIAPLLSVERDFTIDNINYSDSNRFHCANEEIADAILDYLGESKKEIFAFLTDNLRQILESAGVFTPLGCSALLSRITDVSTLISTPVEWSTEDISKFAKFLKTYSETMCRDGLVDLRMYSIANQIIEVGQQLVLSDREAVIVALIDAYTLVLSIPEISARHFDLYFEMTDLATKADYSSDATRKYCLCRIYTTESMNFGDAKSALLAIDYIESIPDSQKTLDIWNAQLEAYEKFSGIDPNSIGEKESYRIDKICNSEDASSFALKYGIETNHSYEFARLTILFKSINILDRIRAEIKGDPYVLYAQLYISFAMALYRIGQINTCFEYLKKCVKAFETKQNADSLSASEKHTLFDVYIKLLMLDEDSKEKSNTVNIQRAFELLKSLYRVSVFVTDEDIIHCYDDLLSLSIHFYFKGQKKMLSLAESIFLQAMDVINSLAESNKQIIEKAIQLIIDYLPVFHTSGVMSSRIDAVSIYQKAVKDIETIGDEGKKQKALLYGYMNLAIYAVVCNPATKRLDTYIIDHLPIIDEGISCMEVFDDECDCEIIHYLLCKGWLLKGYLTMIAYDQYNHTELNYITGRDAFTLFMYGVNYYEFTNRELFKSLERLMMDNFQSYIELLMRSLTMNYQESISRLMEKYGLESFTRQQCSALNNDSRRFRKQKNVEKAIYTAERAFVASYKLYGERSKPTIEACRNLRDAYQESGDIGQALQFHHNGTLLTASENISDQEYAKFSEIYGLYVMWFGNRYFDDKRRIRLEDQEQKELERKEKLMEKEIENRTNSLNEEACQATQMQPSINKAESLIRVAKRYTDLNDREKADSYYRMAIRCYRDVLNSPGDNPHPDCLLLGLANALAMYSQLLSKDGFTNDFAQHAEESLTLYTSLQAATDSEYSTQIGVLSYNLGRFYEMTSNDEKVREYFEKVLAFLADKPEYKGYIVEVRSWLQMHNRLSIKGRICFNFVTGFEGADTTDVEKMCSFSIIDEIGKVVFLSVEMLRNTRQLNREKDYYDWLLNTINGRDFTFIFKQGGGHIDNSDNMIDGENYAIAIAGAIYNMQKWAQVFDELGLDSDRIEKCVDNDSEWVCEFFTMLLNYGKSKFQQDD